MRTVLASSTLLLTIAFSLALGIACGYAVVAAILNAIARKPREENTSPATAVIPIRSH